MGEMATFASFILVALFYFSMLFFTAIGLFMGIRKLLDKKKEKYALKLLDNGFSILTFNSRGIPHLLVKNKSVVTAWYGKQI